MARRRLNILLWFSILAVILACVPTISTPFPTTDPNQVNVFIAQTAHAAASRTAAAMPTSTSTGTPTPTPEDTDTPSPTFTSTVIFILQTPTRPVIPTFTGLSGTSTSSANFACQVISVNPPNGTSFGPRTDFDAVWRVKNIGKRSWDRTTVDYAYASGAKLHKVSDYDLSSNVSVGETISVIVDMVAPKNPGSYTTNWTLRNGTRTFCPMSLTINVQ
jgi:Ig-like domain-containing protein